MFDSIMPVVNSVIQNWGAYAGAAAAFVLVCDRIAKLTPTTKDDSVVNWIYKIFAILGLKVPDLEYNSKGEIVAPK